MNNSDQLWYYFFTKDFLIDFYIWKISQPKGHGSLQQEVLWSSDIYNSSNDRYIVDNERKLSMSR